MRPCAAQFVLTTTLVTLATVAVTLAPDTASAAQGDLSLVEIYEHGNNYGYIEYLPPDYDGITPMPVLVFLSGIGEIGDGLDDGPCSYPTYGPSFNGTAGLCNNLRHGPPYEAWRSLNTGEEHRWPDADRPFIMIAPQNPIVQNAYSVGNLEEFFNWLPSHYAIDQQRMYLTGMSQGGRSALLYLQHDPDRFAAVVMTAGAVSFDQLQNPCPMTQAGFWAFHGENDGHGAEAIFQPQAVVDFVDAFNACPGAHSTSRMTMYLNAGHNVWTRTYYPPTGMSNAVDPSLDPYDIDMYSWLLLHDKPLVDAGPNFSVAEDVADFAIPVLAEDEDAFTLSWEQIAGPAATLYGADTDELLVVPTGPGPYTFRVTMVDGDGQWSEDEITVTVGAGGGGDTEEPIPGSLIFAEGFDGLDATEWPMPWAPTSDVLLAETAAERGYLAANVGSIARMSMSEQSMGTDVDYVATIRFDAFEQQGVALGARQSNFIAGQPLDGYALYVEGGYQESISVWTRVNGFSSQIAVQSIVGLGLQSGVDYRARFQVFTTAEGLTRLRGRVWPAAGVEPSVWHIDTIDGTPVLQGREGSFSVEQYNYAGSDGIAIDDLEARFHDPAGEVVTGGGGGGGGDGGVMGPDGTYVQSFDGADGDAWEVPWIAANANVIGSEIAGGRGRMSGLTSAVATMNLMGPSERDVDAVFSVTYDNFFEQGAGFCLRQNDSPYIDEGYAVFLEGGYARSFGLWWETAGSATQITSVPVPLPEVVDPTYWVRVQAFDEGGQTHLRARYWRDGEVEPTEWHVDVLDGTPELVGTAGSFAFDLYNYAGTGGVSFDDLTITRLGEGGSDAGVSYEVPADAIHASTFDGPNVASWPFPWFASSGAVLTQELFNQQALLGGATNSVARMILPGYDESDTDTAFTVTFDNFVNQGVGLYARHTGTAPSAPGGSGYGVYVEGNTGTIGIWLEDLGVEAPILEAPLGLSIDSGVPYRVRLQVFTELDGQNHARARIWPAGEAEPETWNVDVLDASLPAGGSGTFAFDMFNYTGTGLVQVDDLFIVPVVQ